MNRYRAFAIHNRYRAFAIHLGLSALIVLTVLTLAVGLWYPGRFFAAEGGWTVLRILIFVDLILGPTLTLIVFRPGKKGLRLDLTIIALLQLAALSYGTSVIYSERPAFLVFNVDRFSILSRDDIATDQIPQAALQDAPTHRGLSVIFAERPTDPEERDRLLWEVLEGGPDLEYRPDYYRPYQAHVDAVLERRVAIDDLPRTEPIEAFVARHNGTIADYAYIPVLGRNKDMLMAVAKADGQPVGLIDIDPWASD